MTHHFSWGAFSIALCLALTACSHTSLEDRAEQEARDFTERYCPTPVQNLQRTDSVTFDKASHTFKYHYTLTGAADNIEAINKVRDQLRPALLKDLVGNTQSKVFKEEGYSFQYIYRSATSKKVLYELVLTAKDYQETTK